MRKESSNITNDIRRGMINMLQQNIVTRKQAAITFGVSYSSVVQIYAKFLKNGIESKDKRGGQRPKLLNPDQIESIKNMLMEDCTLTLGELSNKIRELYQIVVSKQTIGRYISAFHFSVKRIQPISVASLAPHLVEDRRVYSEWFLQTYNSGSNLLFFDETGFQVSMRRRNGRSLVGTRAHAIVPCIRSTNKTIMATMGKPAFIHYKALTGNGNTIALVEYLDELFACLRDQRIEHAIFIMDNVSFHRSPAIRTKIEQEGHDLVFLPPYSPFFNPIENFFSQWKNFVRGKNPNNEQELLQAVDDIRTVVTEQHCGNYVQNVVNNAISCLSGNLIVSG
jgi:transposase